VADVGVSDPANDTPYGDNEADRAMLFCGTGVGMSIVANKHPHAYAAVCETTYAAEKSRFINNTNVLTLCGLVTTPQLAQTIINTWLRTDFTQRCDKPVLEWMHNAITHIRK